MAEEPIILTPVIKGTYTGNGTNQTINVNTCWTHLRIVRQDRKYMVDYYVMDGETIAMAAVGAGDQYRIVKALSGGISLLEDGSGFSVGNHLAVNESGKIYYWSVD